MPQTSIEDLIIRWNGIVSWSQGRDTVPANNSSPTIRQLLDWLTDGEQEVLNRVNDVWQTVSVITTEAGQMEYDDLTVELPRSYISAKIKVNGIWRPLKYIDHLILESENADYENTANTGVPRYFHYNPRTDKICFTPIPDGAYEIEVIYRLLWQKLALPAAYVWFIRGYEPTVGGDDTTVFKSDDQFLHKYVDRPRQLLVQGTKAGYSFTVHFVGADDIETSAELTLHASVPATGVYSSFLIKDLTKVVFPPAGEEDHLINIGIADRFSAGAQVTYDVARCVSAIPSEWAERLAPHWAAAMWFESRGKHEEASRQRAIFEENAEKFVKKYTSVPASEPEFFGFSPSRYPWGW